MKNKIITSLAALSATVAPVTIFTCCGEPEPEPVDVRDVQLSEEQKSISLIDGEVNFTYTFTTDWTVSANDGFSFSITSEEATEGHSVEVTYNSEQSIKTHTIVLNATYKCSGMIAEDSNVKFKLDIHCINGQDKWDWTFEHLNVHFNYAQGNIELIDPTQLDGHTNPRENTYTYKFNLNGTPLSDTFGLNITAEKVDAVDPKMNINILTKKIVEGNLEVQVEFDYDEQTLTESNWITFKLHAKYEKDGKILWIQDPVDVFKLTYHDIQEPLVYMPEYEKNGVTYDHFAGTNKQTYTIYYDKTLELEDIEVYEITKHDSSSADFYYDAKIIQGEKLQDYSYAILEIAFWKDSGKTQVWEEDTDINFDITLHCKTEEYTFENYLYKFVITRCDIQPHSYTIYKEDHIQHCEIQANFTDLENYIQCYPIVTGGSENVGIRVLNVKKLDNAKFEYDIELYSTNPEVELQDDSYVKFDMVYVVGIKDSEGNIEYSWLQKTINNELKFVIPARMENKTVKISNVTNEANFSIWLKDGFFNNFNVYIFDFSSQTMELQSETPVATLEGNYLNVKVLLKDDQGRHLADNANIKFELRLKDEKQQDYQIFFDDCKIIVDEANVALNKDVKVLIPPIYQEEVTALRSDERDWIKNGVEKDSTIHVDIDTAVYPIEEWPDDQWPWNWFIFIPKNIDENPMNCYKVQEKGINVTINGNKSSFAWSESGPITIKEHVEHGDIIKIDFKLDDDITLSPNGTTIYFTYIRG